MKRNLGLPFFLVASPNMGDPQFRQAVILLLEHDEEGALGFVINNKSTMTMNDVVAYDQMEIPPGIPVWNAGPVDSSAGFVLHNRQMETFEQEIAPGVCLSASEESLKKLIEAAQASKRQGGTSTPVDDVRYPYRLLVGYSGWSSGQLEAELKAGSWIQTPLDRDILFNVRHHNIWQLALERIGIKQSTFQTPRSPPRWLH